MCYQQPPCEHWHYNPMTGNDWCSKKKHEHCPDNPREVTCEITIDADDYIDIAESIRRIPGVISVDI